MYETIRIVDKLKPKYVLWENVKNLLSKKHIHNFKNYISIMNELGYNSYYQVLNSKNYGIPQNRERVFTLSIRQDIDNGSFTFPKPFELKLKLKDMLEENVDDKYFLSEKMVNFFYDNEQKQKEKGNGFRFGVTNGDTIAKSITTRAGSRMDDNFIKQDIITADFRYDEGLRLRRGGGYQQLQQNVGADNGLAGKPLLLIKNNTKQGYLSASGGDGIYTNTSTKRGTVQKQMIPALTSFQDKGVVLNDLRIRKLTPKECWRLMGFDDTDFEKAEKVNSNAQLYKQAGNSIVVNVLEAILTNLFLKEENDFEGQMNFNMLGDNI